MYQPEIQYPIERSPLFGLQSRKRMCALLGCTTAELAVIRRHKRKLYNHFETADKYGSQHPALVHKPRKIQSPDPDLAKIQARLMDLLKRIELPDYLHSARKNRSYKTNAQCHKYGHGVAKLDVRKFYESTRDSYVYQFFFGKLKCSPDVAHRLTEIACLGRRLPTGSPLSPLMSFLAYGDMFNELANLAKAMELSITVYVDDIVVSGATKASKFIAPAKKIIARHGLSAHKFSVRPAGAPIIVTGVCNTEKGATIPPARYRKIRALKEELGKAKSNERRVVYLKALIGQYREASSFISNAKSHAMAYQRLLEATSQGVKHKARNKGRRRSGRIKAMLANQVDAPPSTSSQAKSSSALGNKG
ncbi:reverse transcriptase family protein [Dyella subtropica]|uniref:reverse transcriptase family protein n=1 Tax=Dyella subtropica TaxID=2992127 RepID=UPI002254ED8B|nr:reverse transcriptase family protein [Dyella subtropica]